MTSPSRYPEPPVFSMDDRPAQSVRAADPPAPGAASSPTLERLAAIARGETTARAWLEECLARIDATNDTVNAFTGRTASRARQEATRSMPAVLAARPCRRSQVCPTP